MMNDALHVLIVDDDAAFRFAMAKALSRRGFTVSEADSGEAALEALGVSSPDVGLLDLRMRGVDGLEVLRKARSVRTRFIVLTGHGSVSAAVDAMKLGAFSFLEKPVDAEVLGPLIEQAAVDGQRPASSRAADAVTPPIVGESQAIEEVRRFVRRAAPSDDTVALYGETGTGKEVVARHLHAGSRRAGKPFVAVNAACVQRELFESELFGHKKGAFTGAASNRDGLFVEAEGGTLFIDEVAELPLDCQAKLLRALETRRIRPVGASREIDVDVRIVCATNRDLWSEVKAGTFREDLFFRLQVLPILLPSLRERTEDLLPLAEHLLHRIGASSTRLDEEAIAAMRAYRWPGNVRELLNVLRRCVLFADGPVIDGALMRRMLAASVFGHAEQDRRARIDRPTERQNLAALERAHIDEVLSRMEGNVTRAASALGIDRRTLQRKLKRSREVD